GRYAKHNSSYWFGEPYLGIGPSAHAFNGNIRQWNIANNALYIRSLQDDKIPFESEVLTPEQRYNEYVMTALRTQWGIDISRVGALGAAFVAHLETEAREFIEVGALVLENGFYKLSKEGKLLADHVASSLFLV
ncbi:MAG: coproporphyrinogen III oxidase, partial [Saprospiraceae bacterium]|nr:coproporphyrinogen III oxidase [Saprospiraceae bacterium]